MSRKQDQRAHETGRRGRILTRYFKVDPLKDDNSHLVRRYLLAAVEAAIVTPLLFYLKFGRVSWFAIGFTIFLIVLCLLVALGLFFQNRSAFHTEVAPANRIGDRIGGFWLLACAFGPLLGWFISSTVFPVTIGSWRWLYFARVFCGIVLPVITAVPLVRYARGKAALVAIPLLLGITTLPMLSCWWVIGDLQDGATTTNIALSRDTATGRVICKPSSVQYDLPCDAARVARATTAQVSWLPHTGRVLEVRKL
jgi:MFS family permease